MPARHDNSATVGTI